MNNCKPLSAFILAYTLSLSTWAADNIIRTQAPIVLSNKSELWAPTDPAYSEWVAESVNCGAWTPDPNTVTQGQTFSQVRTCDKSESRTVQDREISSPSGNYRNVGVSYTENKVTPGGTTENQDVVGTLPKLNGKFLFGTALSGTSNAEGYTVSDSYHMDTRGGWLAFDNVESSYWYPESAYANAHIQVSAPSPVVLRSLLIKYNFSSGLNTGYMATSITIKGSNDGVNYSTITNMGLSYTLSAGLHSTGVRRISNETPYQYYRISIAPTAHPYVALQTLVLSSETNFEM
jgi:hypothetical protein